MNAARGLAWRSASLLAGAVALALLLNLPWYPIAGLQRTVAGFQPLGLASVLHGDAVRGAPRGWLSWDWCPGWNPARWCIAYESAAFSLQAVAKPGGDARISLRQARLRIASSALPFALPSGLGFTLAGRVDRLDWRPDSCVPDFTRSRELSLRLQDLRAGALALADHALEREETGPGRYRFAIRGPALEGTLALDDDGNYSLRMSAAQPDGSWGETVEANGRWNCGETAR